MRSGDFVYYYGALFPLRDHGSYPGRSPGNGTFCCAYAPFHNRNCRNQSFVDLCVFPSAQIPSLFVHFLSGILDRYDPYAGGVLLLCAEAVYEGIRGKNMQREKGMI